MPAFLAPLLAVLAEKGLGLLAGAIEAKGKEAVEKVIGVKIPNDPKDLNPELLQQLQVRQMEHEEFLTTAGLKELELRLADVSNARQRDIQLVQTLGQRNVRADIMIVCDWLGLVACLVVLAFFRKDIPGEVVALLSTIASIFGLCLRDAHQFEFGSSKSSREKDKALMKWVDES